MSKDGKAIGIDIGGTNFRIGTIDRAANAACFEKVSSDILCHGAPAIELLADYIRDYINRYQLTGQIGTVGIGFPSPVEPRKGVVYNCPNLVNPDGGFDGLAVNEELGKRLQIPVFANKDSNNLLRYEIAIHDWKGKGSVIGLYYGTGLGNSVYLGDHFLYGKHGVATDLGHIPVLLSDRYCTCGNRGCIECYCSGHVLRDIWEEHYAAEPFTELFVNHAGDKLIEEFIEAMAVPLGAELNIFDPDRVVLGGGVFNMKGFPLELYYDKVYEFTRKPMPGHDYEIVFASDNPEAGAAGSALIAFDRLDN